MLKIIKNIYIAMLTLLIVCACSHDEIIEIPLTQDEIVFAATSGRVTRAGETSLARYIDNFRIYGTNTKDESNSLVFGNYVLWYDEETTQSNTSNWEYVGFDPVDNKLQTIKYWDFSAFPYTFWAIAGADKGSFTQKDEYGRISSFVTSMNENDGKVLYYTKPTVITKDQYTDPVTFCFVGAHSRIRFAFYETVPGYAVKDVKFYLTAGDEPSSLCLVNGSFNVSADLTLAYSYSGEPDVSPEFGNLVTESHHTFGNLNYTKAASGWLADNGGSDYLGVLSSAPTYAGDVNVPGYYTSIIPYVDNPTPITINVDYTLVALDKSGQKIEITGAKASVPSPFCQWKPNCSYTYLFKITDSELSPISFVAVGEIDNTTDNQQGTITTLGDYSITTHQNGDTDDEGIVYESAPYVADRPIDISVVLNDAETETVTPVTLIGGENSTDFVRIYHQTTVNEWVVETTETQPVTEITYSDGMASFRPSETGTYRIEYWHKDGESDAKKMAVKIVAIGAILHSTGHTGNDLGNAGTDDLELKME